MREACRDESREAMCGAKCRCSEVVVVEVEVEVGDAAVELLFCFPRGRAERGEGRRIGAAQSCFSF
jgi:hypothetical protein